MDVWKPKYLSTRGAEKVSVTVMNDDGWLRENNYRFGYLGKNYFETRDEAIAAAEAEKDKRLASLRRQISKLEKLRYAVA